MTHRKLHTIIVLGMVAVLLASCDLAGSQPATPTPVAKTRLTIALGYIPDVQFAPYYVALGKGYYDAEGLDVSFKHGIVPDLIKLLGAGEEGINFAAASGDEVIPARLQGIPVVYVTTWYRQYPVAAASIVGKGPTLKSPADLKGHVVGIPGPFGANYTGLLALLKAGGLTKDDVQLKNINFTQVESLATGQVEVAMVYAANEPVQLRTRGFDVSTLMVSDYVKLASNGMITNEKTLKENPNLVARVVRATQKGIQATIDDPAAAFDEALKQVPEAGGENKDRQMKVLEETIKLMKPKPDDPAASKPLGWTDAEVWNSTQDFLLEAGVITEKGNVQEMFTNDFVGAATSNR
jgi:NitT/TauT family transport system substrate-binding protein